MDSNKRKSGRNCIRYGKKGEISSQDSKKWVDDLVHKIDEGKKEAESKIERIVEATLKKLNIPTRSEVDELNAVSMLCNNS